MGTGNKNAVVTEAAVTDQQAFTRRTSYGPSSPVIGSRGAQTRQQVIDAALECFTEHGFHGTAVDDIAVRAETSRATVYQYFESKEAVFIELMNASGAALQSLNRALGELGPTTAGYRNLHRWLQEWSWNFDRYAAMYIEWANVNSQKTELRPRIIAFVDSHTKRFSERLIAAGSDPGEAPTSALLVLAMASRFNYIRHVYRPSTPDDQLVRSLASALQLFLFPDTPVSVLADRSTPVESDDSNREPSKTVGGPLATLTTRKTVPASKSFEGLSPKAAKTVRELLDAAGRVFAMRGYDAANIDHIVTEAGLARGTFYRYFDNKLELITALAEEAAAAMCPIFEEFEKFGDHVDRSELTAWLHRFLDLHKRYAGVTRAWTEQFPIDPPVLAPAADVVDAISRAVAATFGPPRPYVLGRGAAVMMLSSLLEHFPNEGLGAKHEPTDQQIVDAQARFIERVLLPR